MSDRHHQPGEANSSKSKDLSELWRSHETLITNQPLLGCAQIPRKFYDAARDGFHKSIPKPDEYFKLAFWNYERAFHELLYIEEAFRSIEVRRHDLKNCEISLKERRLTYEDHAQYRNERGKVWHLQFRVAGLANGEPAMNLGDMAVFERAGQYHEQMIHRIEGDLILCKLKPYELGRYQDQLIQNISLVPSGIPFKRNHLAIEALRRNLTMKKGLLNDEPGLARVARIDFEATKTLQSETDLRDCNADQREAIKNMIENRCRPKPFILFGPPGTGKTFTLIKAIGQLLVRQESATILISANSNVCADDLAERLVSNELVNAGELIRFTSKSLLDKIPESQLKSYQCSEWPAQRVRVCVTTNVCSGRIRDQKFDYVMVDEAGHANEPEALIPMSKLKSGDVCVILAGDHKQLGPVVKLTEVGKFGLSNSILTRLLAMKIYKKNPTGVYKTELRESYRCDPRIMKFWARVSYKEKDLISMGAETPKGLVDSLVDSMGCDYRFPLVFVHVEGMETQFGGTTSRFNLKEAEKCVELLKKLRRFVEPARIGIISPYKLQAKTITKMLTEEARADRRNEQRDRRRQKRREKKSRRNKQNKSQATGRDSPASGTDESVVVDSAIELEEKWLRYEKHLIDRRDVYKSRQAGQPQQASGDDSVVKIDTVDAFQGGERDIIIISTVRTPAGGTYVPFLDDPKRFNVAMSRAKQYLIVVGHREILSNANYWKQYLSYIRNSTRVVPRQA